MIVSVIAYGIDLSMRMSIWVVNDYAPIYRDVLTGFVEDPLDADFVGNDIPELFTDIKSYLLTYGVKVKSIIKAEHLPEPKDEALEMVQRLLIHD